MYQKNLFRSPFFLLLLLSTFTLLTCSRNPVTGKKELMLVSKNQELAMGAQADPSIVATYGLYKNDNLQKFIDRKGQQMARISHRPNLKYEFKILDSPVINAFAVPGGYVYFTRGILAHFNNEAEFAGVLGHEIGHITARHSAKQYSKQMVAQIGLIAGMVAVPEFAQFGQLAQQGLGLLFLKFGRDAESQSDRLGVEYSTKINYDAHHMANFFRTLDRLGQQSGASEIPTFLSTHPHPADRYMNVNKQADKWQQKLNKGNNLNSRRNEYLRMIDGLVYGEDPRQGYVQNNMFYHPELKFQYPIPSGWQTVNTNTQVQHAPKDGKAALILGLSNQKSLTQAADAFVQQHKLTVKESGQTNVNGLPALALVTDQINQQNAAQSIRILTYFIQYNNLIYQINGLALINDFDRYLNYFNNTMKGFKKLTDQSKINVKPERIKIITASRTGTLSQILQQHNVPSKRMNELAILNSMELKDTVQKGTLLKVIQK